MGYLLKVNDLKTVFETDSGLIRAVDGISYHVDSQEVVGIAGESACGKSVSQLSVLQLIRPPGSIVGGEVLFEGNDLLELESNSAGMRSIRGAQIGIIFQEPMTSLNPVLTIGRQLTEMLELHLGMNKRAARHRAIELLGLVGIPNGENRIDSYPYQFSGGMRQRVMIAMALSCNPKLLIADEPTTALDVITQAQLLETLLLLRKRFNTSLVIVTHNLGILARWANRIYIMYAGRIVESGTVKDVFADPRHPYTIGLLNSVPRMDYKRRKRLIPIVGSPPNLLCMPPTCAFLPRCPYRTDECARKPWPRLELVRNNHYTACYIDVRDKRNEQIK